MPESLGEHGRFIGVLASLGHDWSVLTEDKNFKALGTGPDFQDATERTEFPERVIVQHGPKPEAIVEQPPGIVIRLS